LSDSPRILSVPPVCIGPAFAQALRWPIGPGGASSMLKVATPNGTEIDRKDAGAGRSRTDA